MQEGTSAFLIIQKKTFLSLNHVVNAFLLPRELMSKFKQGGNQIPIYLSGDSYK